MGKFDTHGGYFAPKGYFRINEGGSHEENPNGGVQIGVDQNGTPNMLEEGEPVYNDYVYSDNIIADIEMLQKHNLPTKYAGRLYSEIADLFVDEAEERPLDPISNNGLNAMLVRLADAQEEQKTAEQQAQMEEMLGQLSPEQLNELENLLATEQQAEQEQAMQDQAIQEQMMQQQAMPQESMQQSGGYPEDYFQPNMQAQMGAAQALQQMPPMMMACGGKLNLFDTGGGAVRDKRQKNLKFDPSKNLLNNNIITPVDNTAVSKVLEDERGNLYTDSGKRPYSYDAVPEYPIDQPGLLDIILSDNFGMPESSKYSDMYASSGLLGFVGGGGARNILKGVKSVKQLNLAKNVSKQVSRNSKIGSKLLKEADDVINATNEHQRLMREAKVTKKLISENAQRLEDASSAYNNSINNLERLVEQYKKRPTGELKTKIDRAKELVKSNNETLKAAEKAYTSSVSSSKEVAKKANAVNPKKVSSSTEAAKDAAKKSRAEALGRSTGFKGWSKSLGNTFAMPWHQFRRQYQNAKFSNPNAKFWTNVGKAAPVGIAGSIPSISLYADLYGAGYDFVNPESQENPGGLIRNTYNLIKRSKERGSDHEEFDIDAFNTNAYGGHINRFADGGKKDGGSKKSSFTKPKYRYIQGIPFRLDENGNLDLSLLKSLPNKLRLNIVKALYNVSPYDYTGDNSGGGVRGDIGLDEVNTNIMSAIGNASVNPAGGILSDRNLEESSNAYSAVEGGGVGGGIRGGNPNLFDIYSNTYNYLSDYWNNYLQNNSVNNNLSRVNNRFFIYTPERTADKYGYFALVNNPMVLRDNGYALDWDATSGELVGQGTSRYVRGLGPYIRSARANENIPIEEDNPILDEQSIEEDVPTSDAQYSTTEPVVATNIPIRRGTSSSTTTTTTNTSTPDAPDVQTNPDTPYTTDITDTPVVQSRGSIDTTLPTPKWLLNNPRQLKSEYELLNERLSNLVDLPKSDVDLSYLDRYADRELNRNRRPNRFNIQNLRYWGPIANALQLGWNIFQKPDRLNVPYVSPVLPNGRMHLIDTTYNPLDENSAVASLGSANARTHYNLANSGLGPSAGAAMVAADNNYASNYGNALAQIWDANNQRRNAVIGQRNKNRQALGNFHLNINNTRAGILNQFALQNLQNDLMRQRYNHYAESQRWNNISQSLDALNRGISDIGVDAYNRNMANSIPGLDYDVDENGNVGYTLKKGNYKMNKDGSISFGCGGTLLKKYRR